MKKGVYVNKKEKLFSISTILLRKAVSLGVNCSILAIASITYAYMFGVIGPGSINSPAWISFLATTTGIGTSMIGTMLLDIMHGKKISDEEVEKLLEEQNKSIGENIQIGNQEILNNMTELLGELKIFELNSSDEHQAIFNLIIEESIKVTTTLNKLATHEDIDRLRVLFTTESTDKKKISVGHLPNAGKNIFGREKEIEILDKAWSDSLNNIITVIAWGGVGKSTLIEHWLIKLGQEKFRGADRVFAWSFYTQGVTDRVMSSDLFIEFALHWFGDPDSSKGSPWEKGERLARLIKINHTLLIIDGLEPLQYPPGPREGELKDIALQALLRELAAYNPGLCIVTSRLPVEDLKQFESTTCPRIDLENLSPEAGAQLLLSEKVNGSFEELKQASIDFGGHALALSLLGGFIRIAYKGDISQRNKVNLLDEDEVEGGHAFRVLASYEKWFGSGPEIPFMQLLCLFDRPIDCNIIISLTEDPIIPGITTALKNLNPIQWRRIIEKLIYARLLSQNNSGENEYLDVHPLIREYFRKNLIRTNLIGWRVGNNRLFEYYKNLSIQLPQSLREMDPLFMAMVHGCRAERYQETLHEIYYLRIMRGDEAYAANVLGAVGTIVSVLSNFFESGEWGHPTDQLSIEDQIFVLIETGRYLTEVRGYGASDVGKCYKRAEKLCTRDKQLFEVMLGLCRYHRIRGELFKSGQLAKNLLSLARELGDPNLLPSAERALSTNYYYTGNFSAAIEHAKKGITNYANQQQALRNAQLDVNEPRISCLGYQALSLWFLGFPDKSVYESRNTIREAKSLHHAHTLTISLLIDAMIYQFRRNPSKAKYSSNKLINLCSEQGFSLWRISGEIIYAWSLTMLGQTDKSVLEKMQQSIISWKMQEAELFTPYWYGLFAEAALITEEIESGLNAIEIGLKFSNKNGEHWWDSELKRIKGELMQKKSTKPSSVKIVFREAINIAKRQSAKSLQLRATKSLVIICQKYNSDEGIKELSTLYNWFTEGKTTDDIEAARKLLEKPKNKIRKYNKG